MKRKHKKIILSNLKKTNKTTYVAITKTIMCKILQSKHTNKTYARNKHTLFMLMIYNGREISCKKSRRGYSLCTS